MTSVIQTIEDLQNVYYSKRGYDYLHLSSVDNPFINKDDAVTTTTTGVLNVKYGAQAWCQLNMESNTFGVLPKTAWNRSGWRAITARSTTRGSRGVAEGGAVPATTKPTWAEVSTLPKTCAESFDVSEIQDFLAKNTQDDAISAMNDFRVFKAAEHKEEMNYELNKTAGTLAGYDFESVDRLIGSYAELNGCTDAANAAFDAGDLDPYASATFDRDGGATWVDAHVSENDGTDRILSESIIMGAVQNTLTNGANGQGQFWQTGYDTWGAINLLFEPQVRYNVIGAANIQPGVNGIQTLPGKDAGFEVATLHNRPLIQSKDTVQETSGISRMLLYDTSNPEGFDYPRIFIKMAKPTQYSEAGANAGTILELGTFTTKGMYHTMGELICSFFKVQGKIRDLKS